MGITEQPRRHYNIPSNNRELQHIVNIKTVISIITYQVITGNYSLGKYSLSAFKIITYQVITGNYSTRYTYFLVSFIITYQVITGNYS